MTLIIKVHRIIIQSSRILSRKLRLKCKLKNGIFTSEIIMEFEKFNDLIKINIASKGIYFFRFTIKEGICYIKHLIRTNK